MTGYERIAAALSGRMPDKIPIMLHNFMMVLMTGVKPTRYAVFIRGEMRNE